MSTAPMLMTALSGASQAYSSHEAGNTNRAIDRFNAANDRVAAQQTLQSAGSAMARQDIKANILQGEQRSAFAGQGVLANAGTARAVVAGSQAVSEMDKLMIGINARRAATGHLQRAAYEDFQGDRAAAMGNERALGSIIDAGTKMESMRYKSDGTIDQQRRDADSFATDARRASLLADESSPGDYPVRSPGTIEFS